MGSRHKNFGSTIPQGEKGQKYHQFGPLNQSIEQENNSFESALQSYHDILLGDISDQEKTSVHWQIQYLIQEVGVAVNTIHEFLSFKFYDLKTNINELLQSSDALRNKRGKLGDQFNSLLSEKQSIFLGALMVGGNDQAVECIKEEFYSSDSDEQKIGKLKKLIERIDVHYHHENSIGVRIVGGKL